MCPDHPYSLWPCTNIKSLFRCECCGRTTRTLLKGKQWLFIYRYVHSMVPVCVSTFYVLVPPLVLFPLLLIFFTLLCDCCVCVFFWLFHIAFVIRRTTFANLPLFMLCVTVRASVSMISFFVCVIWYLSLSFHLSLPLSVFGVAPHLLVTHFNP